MSTPCMSRLISFLVLGIFSLSMPAQSQTGLTPINDLGAGSYAGFPGGLYPGGLNSPPPAHLADALARAAQVVPRNAAGAPDAAGWIGMIAVGMSNTTHEFGAFERNADADPGRNARVVLLDTGFGGQTATILANPAAGYWTTMMNRLTAMNLTAAQVQVAWLKEAEAMPLNNFPIHAQALRDTLIRVVQNLHTKFPNLQLCYVSSRTYGGYSAPGTLNPEPQAYESGFSVKWLIEAQIQGDPRLNYGQLPPPIRAPLLLWGPYLWADGPNPRSDGLTWAITDFEADHVHPSPSGEQKVAGLLASFFATDATAAPWWPAQTGVTLVVANATHDAYVSAATPNANFGAQPLLLAQGGDTPSNTYLNFDVSSESRPIVMAKLSLRVSQSGGGGVRLVSDTSWNENTLTYSTAPPIGAGLVLLPQSSRDGTIGANVTANVLADGDRHVAYALTAPASGPVSYVSKEGGDAPRLVLVVSTATSGAPERQARLARLRALSPNPTFGRTRIEYSLARPGLVSLGIYSVDGRIVRRLLAASQPEGLRDVWWDGRDEAGRRVGAGMYLVRLTSGATTTSEKLTLVR